MVVGCGSQLTFKLTRDVLKKDLVCLADSLDGHVSLFNDSFFIKNPLESSSIVLVDNVSIERFMPSFLKSTSLVICCNRTVNQKFVKMIGEVGYSASASVDNVDDFMKKLNKAYVMTGLRYIEVLSPCPKEWSYDTSLTVHVASAAVESGVWPLFEIENRKVVLGPRPAKLGVLESFHSIQPKYRFEQKDVEGKWKELVQLSLK